MGHFQKDFEAGVSAENLGKAEKLSQELIEHTICIDFSAHRDASNLQVQSLEDTAHSYLPISALLPFYVILVVQIKWQIKMSQNLPQTCQLRYAVGFMFRAKFLLKSVSSNILPQKSGYSASFFSSFIM